MKIGYPCINREIGCTANSTFRLKSYSKEVLISKVQNNLDCLKKILEFNVKNKIFFFRISSQIVPFASHPVCKVDWGKIFKKQFEEIGKYIKKNKIRINMHPDQFILLNAKDKNIVKRSIKELEYHCKVLNLMKLDSTAKVQIHVGGVYDDKEKSIERFINEFKKSSDEIKKRLVIENDDYKFSLKDCLQINKAVKIPVVFDNLHHECLNNNESVKDAAKLAFKTWRKKDGIPFIDYSTQDKTKRKGAHTQSIDLKHFKDFLQQTKGFDFDIMLEIKDKEKSASKAIKLMCTL